MLKPTASNKMFNARVTYRNFGGLLSELTFAPDASPDIEYNFNAFLKLIGNRKIDSVELAADLPSQLRANICVVEPKAVVAFLKDYRWSNTSEKQKQLPMQFQIEFLQGSGTSDPQINDWLILAPQILNPPAEILVGGTKFSVISRDRVEARFATYNDPKHRAFAQHIAGNDELKGVNDALAKLRTAHRGVMIYYPVTPKVTPKPVKKPRGPFTTGFTLIFPPNDIVTPITFGVRRTDQPGQPVVQIDRVSNFRRLAQRASFCEVVSKRSSDPAKGAGDDARCIPPHID